MKKILLTFALIGIVFLPNFALAADKFGLGTAAAGRVPTTVGGANDIPGIVSKVISLGLGLLAVGFFLLILYAGFIWMTAMGDKGKIDRAKDIMEAAIIGVIIVLASYAISTFVFTNIVK
jgi:hypothetical protein